MSRFPKPLLITVMGATATGKTKWAIDLAKHFETEIISADSRQFYRKMDIGTAKPTPEEQAAVKHHFIDVFDVDEPYSAGQYESDALATIEKLFAERLHAVMVGGSGLYINAVLYGIDPFPSISKEVRERVVDWYEKEGIEKLRDELRARDPKYYLEVDLDNPRRLMRALEVCLTTETSYSDLLQAEPKPRPFKPVKIAFDYQREVLYARINHRVDLMMEQGLEEEARSLYPFRKERALDTIGYKELFGYFDGLYDKAEAIRLIKRNSRRYAKRQLTWLRKDEDIRWYRPTTRLAQIVEEINDLLI